MMVEGPNDAGIAHYTSARDGSLYRECLQNSIDAAAGSGRVNIEIEMLDIPCEAFAGLDLADHLEWSANELPAGDPQRGGFREAAKQLRSGECVKCLAIKDTGTTGVEDSGRGRMGNPWVAMTQGSGVSVKPDDRAMGSFGIGKNAPFATTPLRAVLYSTRYRRNGTAEDRFMGRAILSFHRPPPRKSGGGPSAFGANGILKPAGGEIPGLFKLGQTGTGVFIPGYSPDGDSGRRGWKQSVIDAIADNFFYAILRGRLDVVVIGETEDSQLVIDKDALAAQEEFKVTSKATRRYIELCANPPAAATYVEGVGDVSLYLSVGDGEPDRRSVALVRAPGLLLTDTASRWKAASPQIPREWKRVTAVVVCAPRAPAAGRCSDWVIRACENPAHDQISVDQITETPERTRKQAKKGLTELSEWLRGEIAKLAEPVTAEVDCDIDEMKEFGLVVDDPQAKPKVRIAPPSLRRRAPTAQDLGPNDDTESDDGEPGSATETEMPLLEEDGNRTEPPEGQPTGGEQTEQHAAPSKTARPPRPRIALKPIFRPLLNTDRQPDTHGVVVSFQPPTAHIAKTAPNGLRAELQVVGEDETRSRMPVRQVRSLTPKIALKAVHGSLVVPVDVIGRTGRIEAELRTAEPVAGAAFDLRPKLFDPPSANGNPQ